MVFGTFDIFHQGHENFLKQAKGEGDYLVAVIARDKTVLEVKGKKARSSENDRLKRVLESGLVDRAVLGCLDDKYKIINKLKPDIVCLGYDQNSFTKNLAEKLKEFKLNTKVVRLKSYKPEQYKSSKL